jgi:membrane protease YdiL (CAAX protease family)
LRKNPACSARGVEPTSQAANRQKALQMKAKAVFEVVIVFSLTLLLIALAALSPIGKWERQVSNRPFIEYAVMIAFPLLFLGATRRNLASYGLSMRNASYHLDVMATAFVPVAIASSLAAFINYMEWSGALILAGVQIAVLFASGWLLKSKPTQNESGILVGVLLLKTYPDFTQKATLENAMCAFIFYILFLGFGEELIFRGYIQSRLNAVFGKPFQFHGVNWGGGIIVASALFGFMHVLNIGSLVSGDWIPAWWWGFWTFFGGLVLGFVREKTGSIAASTLLHGLPQAIAYAILGL